ncbi:hypothetical protein E5A73_20910 [Sphingomonas gei]|uniref:Carrier domain-containing protein n=1 Tax=Sphingomonas gei TaxID=1395960 RepID=A0A4S1WZ96_9SPHN|nr:phosphopantetheine-binding protein [Sphingomonas gei]TGX48673.1 hypothetical protein E5A73_20910 [Sphingomonas gei]
MSGAEIDEYFLSRSKIGGALKGTDFDLSELDIDSLSFMDVIMEIEQEKNVVLRDDEVNNILQAQKISQVAQVFDAAYQRQSGGHL